jgi:drug/metabolite transporter (DMT)-like permease
MLGIALAILSSVTSAFSVVLVRKYSNQSTTFNISLAISLVGTAALWPLAFAMTDFSRANFLSILIFSLSGILTPGFVRLLYYAGLKKLGASVNSSIFSIYPLYTAMLSLVFLSEMLAPNNWIGILLVFVGGFLVEWSSRKPKSETQNFRKSLIYPLLGGIVLAFGAIMRKYALNLYDAPVLGVALAYSFSLLPFLLMIGISASTRREISLKRDLRLFWGAGVGQAVTWLLAFYALSFEGVSVVTPLLSTEPLFIVIFVYVYLKRLECVSKDLVLSVILTMIGVVLVSAKF